MLQTQESAGAQSRTDAVAVVKTDSGRVLMLLGSRASSPLNRERMQSPAGGARLVVHTRHTKGREGLGGTGGTKQRAKEGDDERWCAKLVVARDGDGLKQKPPGSGLAGAGWRGGGRCTCVVYTVHVVCYY